MSLRSWYPRYPGDYARKTADLTLEMHGAYTLLMDHYYSNGGIELMMRDEPLDSPANAGILYRICRAFSEHEQKCVRIVASRFFSYESGRLVQQRIEEEIQKSEQISERRRDAANRRWTKGGDPAGGKADAKAEKPSKQADPAKQPSFIEGEQSDGKKRKHVFSALDMQLAEKLYEGVLLTAPNAKKPNMDSWANEIRLMVQQDKREYEQIDSLIAFVGKDSFWSKVCLSPDNLRRNYDKIEIQLRTGAPRAESSASASAQAVDKKWNGLATSEEHLKASGGKRVFTL